MTATSIAPVWNNEPADIFDYRQVTSEHAAELRKIAARVHTLHKSHVAKAVEIGSELAKAKEMLGHGNFMAWLAAEVRWAECTARRYMSLAAELGEVKSANLSVLDLTTAYKLASPSTPAEVRTKVVEQLEAGEPVRPDEVRDQIAEAKHAAAEAQKRARMPPTEHRKPRRTRSPIKAYPCHSVGRGGCP